MNPGVLLWEGEGDSTPDDSSVAKERHRERQKGCRELPGSRNFHSDARVGRGADMWQFAVSKGQRPPGKWLRGLNCYNNIQLH